MRIAYADDVGFVCHVLITQIYIYVSALVRATAPCMNTSKLCIVSQDVHSLQNVYTFMLLDQSMEYIHH